MALLRILLIALATIVLGMIALVLTPLSPGGRVFFILARRWSRLVLWTCRARLSVQRHPGVPPPGAAIYMANHQSLLDVPALIVALPQDCRFVAKSVLSHVPIFGWALRAAGFIFIDRADRQQAIGRLDRAADRLRQGEAVVIFAEGTRSPDGRLLPFKKGGFVLALKAGVPIVPVAVRGGATLLPKGSLRGRPGDLVVAIGGPVDSKGFSTENKEALMRLVRERIDALLAGQAGIGAGVPAPR